MAKARKRSHPRDLRGGALLAIVFDFQMIEEALKRYLTVAYGIIGEATRGKLPVKLSRTDVEDLPLGRLIDRFAKFTDDAGLVRDLHKLRSERDRCAHRAFMEAMIEGRDRDKALAEYKRLLAVRKQVRSAGDRVVEHLRRLHSLR